MFTGLVQDIGELVSARRRGEAVLLSIAPRVLACRSLHLGESIAIDGTCLTVTEPGDKTFSALAGPETLKLTTLGGLRPGARVNLERALLASDRLGGHIVAGHVDGMGEIGKKRPQGEALDVTVFAPSELLRYVVLKGSIAVDGISLTVNAIDARGFTVGLIPHTIDNTTLGKKNVGERVNLEVDIVGKYVEKFAKEHVRR